MTLPVARLQAGILLQTSPLSVRKMIDADFPVGIARLSGTKKLNRIKVVPRGGIEPPTLRFSVACSTN